jgi:hypothetical protein
VNRYQKILLIVAFVNIGVIMLFPPLDAVPLARATARTFDGFFYVFGYHVNRMVNTPLLHLEIFVVLINMLIAWLLLQDGTAGAGVVSRGVGRNGIFAMIAGNIAIMLLFPPFESYASLTRLRLPSFDGFYFIFGDKSRRNLFIPILHMQGSFVLINGALFTLLFGESERAQRDLSPEPVAALAKELSPENTRKLAKELQQQILIESLKHPRPAADPPGGNERRKRERDENLCTGSCRRFAGSLVLELAA